jgi:hypothetical protein
MHAHTHTRTHTHTPTHHRTRQQVKGTDCTACTGDKYDGAASSSRESIAGQTSLTSSRYTDGNAMSGFLAKESLTIAGQAVAGLTFVAAANLTGFGSSVNG